MSARRRPRGTLAERQAVRLCRRCGQKHARFGNYYGGNCIDALRLRMREIGERVRALSHYNGCVDRDAVLSILRGDRAQEERRDDVD